MMASVEYDLDCSGGLMPQVQALIAPPISEEAAKIKKNEKLEHPYFKRPGKGHNHDNCDACSEGGDLICCDKCPASFHLTCHDPPLEEKDIPTGQWLCHHCRKTKELSLDKNPQPRNKRSNSSASSSESNTSPTKLKKAKLSPMDVLVKAASLMNPKQFELPRNINMPCIFPGTDKVEYLTRGSNRSKNRSGNNAMSYSNSNWTNKASTAAAAAATATATATAAGGKDLKKSSGYELTNGLVPLPARTCFECRKSCRVGPLLSCDYCPLLFHLDCLDPPLTALPAGRWMCPNHIEQYIDSKLVTSVSATERIRLWDKFSGPVDQDAVKMEFFRKVHCKNPPFRFKVRLGSRKRVSVPEMVRNHYKNPVPLLPSLKDVLRLETVTNRSREYLEYVTALYVNAAAANNNCNQINNAAAADDEVVPAIKTNLDENDDDDNLLVKKGNKKLNGQTNQEIEIKIEDDDDDDDDDDILTKKLSGPVLHADIEKELKQLDERLIRLLAFQRIQHLLSHQQLQQFDIAQNFVANHRQMPLPSELLTPADIDRITRVFTSPKRSKTPRLRSTLRARAMLCPVVSKHFYNVRTSEVDPSQVRHDASFMGFRPTVSARFPEAAAMRYRSLTIGRGSSNDVELERFGYCNYTSSKHAVIFYDECTKHYELINYSEYGTQVNNVLYSCDFSDKTTGAASAAVNANANKNEEQNNKSVSFIATVREIVDKKRKVQRKGPRENGIETRMTAVAEGYDNLECQCGANPPSTAIATSEADGSGIGSTVSASAGWEGAAVLGHGALLRFGCITFVFSIVECATV